MFNEYIALKERQHTEIMTIPMFFAYSRKQFNIGMRKIGLDPSEKEKVTMLSGTCGYYPKEYSEQVDAMIAKFNREHWEAINADREGTGYIYQMFRYEFACNAFGVMLDLSDVLKDCRLTLDDIGRNDSLKKGFKKALWDYLDKIWGNLQEEKIEAIAGTF